MKSAAILKEIKSLQSQLSKSSTLYKFLVAMSDEVHYLTEQNKDSVPKYHIENIIRETTNQSLVFQIVIFFQHLQNLGTFSADGQEPLLLFIESLVIKYKEDDQQLKLYSLMMTLQNNLTLENLDFALRYLRVCAKLFLTQNKVLKLSIITLIDSTLSQLGRSARLILCREDRSEIMNALKRLILLFASVIDGQPDLDFDVSFAIKAINTLFTELNLLLLLLDPEVVCIIKSNLSIQLKKIVSQDMTLPLSQQQHAFRCMEILMIGNPLKFADFLQTLSKFIFAEQHTHAKKFSFKVLVEAAKSSFFVELLRIDAHKHELVHFYEKLVELAKLPLEEAPSKVQQIQEVVGNIVSLESMYEGISDNKFVLDQIARFNVCLSETYYESEIKLPIILQTCVRKCHKHLITKVEPSKILRSYFNFCFLLESENKEQLVLQLFLIEQTEKVTAVLTEILFSQKGKFSSQVWSQYLENYFRIDDDSELKAGMKQTIFHYFEIDVLQTIYVTLIKFKAEQLQHALRLLIQLVNKHYNRVSFILKSIIQKLIESISESKLPEYAQCACSLMILRFERQRLFDQEMLLEISKVGDQRINNILLSNVATICKRYQIEDIDIILAVLNQFKNADRILQTMVDIIQNRNLLEQSWDIILDVFAKNSADCEQIDYVVTQMFRMISTNDSYSTALFQLICKTSCSAEIVFDCLSQLVTQPFMSSELSQELFGYLMLHSRRFSREFVRELCRYTFKVVKLDASILKAQFSYLQQCLEKQDGALLLETTKAVRLYITEFPKEQALFGLIESYDFLYSQSLLDLTKFLCLIVDDLLDIMAVMFKHSISNIKTLFCLYGKLIQIMLYPDFEECIEKCNIRMNLAQYFTLFVVIKDRIRLDQEKDSYYVSQYQSLVRKLINLKQNSPLKVKIVELCIKSTEWQTSQCWTIYKTSESTVQEAIRESLREEPELLAKLDE